jgi:hypothetical protein
VAIPPIPAPITMAVGFMNLLGMGSVPAVERQGFDAK